MAIKAAAIHMVTNMPGKRRNRRRENENQGRNQERGENNKSLEARAAKERERKGEFTSEQYGLAAIP